MDKQYRSPKARHRHKCSRCGTVWEHSDYDTLRPPNAHQCPKCDNHESTKYIGPDTPTVKQ